LLAFHWTAWAAATNLWASDRKEQIMAQQLMTHSQQSTSSALWALDGGDAFRLTIGPGIRELHVTEGRLWLTGAGTPQQPAEDIWLSAGESITLASGSEWVAEAWGAARFQLLVPPIACSSMRRKFSASPLPRASAWHAVPAAS
jgi:hypothetical protein